MCDANLDLVNDHVSHGAQMGCLTSEVHINELFSLNIHIFFHNPIKVLYSYLVIFIKTLLKKITRFDCLLAVVNSEA